MGRETGRIVPRSVDWDRVVRATRLVEEGRSSPDQRVPHPIAPQPGFVSVRILGRRLDSAIFGAAVDGTDDPKGPYPARFVSRNLFAKSKEEMWTAGGRCLVFPNNPEDELGYGCVYHGFVTGDVPDNEELDADDRNGLSR
jgi:hypothetical protein